MGVTLGLVLLVGLWTAAPAPGPIPAGQLPQRAGHINDYAHVLSSADIVDLERLASEILRTRHVEIAVVILHRPSNGDAQATARDLLAAWGVGGAPGEAVSGVVLAMTLADGGVGLAVNDVAAPYLGQAQVDALLDDRVRGLLAERRFGPALRRLVGALGRMLEP
jgi:uncharacterized membrane protein YgcG